ncbi:MAG: type II CRISPR RNA-guided endonuclease Cas9, partial [Pseudomonadota bacterium]|nr:type II CRISPR RNA-guided endonuclease Cas9 [Pseudomonadota bacterium]
QRSVEDKTPTPKNQARRNARMARRIIQRRSRRKQRMLNYLISLNFLPQCLKNNPQPEAILNDLGDPYFLRTKALDEQLSEHELGRVLLHLVQRRGFQSNRKTLLGDMVDDPDTLAIFSEEGEEIDKEESTFKQEIAVLRTQIHNAKCRTLGEYLNQLPDGQVKRNRIRDGGTLRTDRQMYKEEFWAIINQQKPYYPSLEEFQEELFSIIFFQRPLKLKKDRVGKCSLEPRNNRAKKAWRAFQKYRYLQDINSLKFFDSYTAQWNNPTETDRQKLIHLFEHESKVSIAKIKKTLGLSKNHTVNFENAGNKFFKGNLTAITIRNAYPEWDTLPHEQQYLLEEDLISFESKKALKKRLINHWGIPMETAIQLCLLELEPEHSDLSLKAINNLLPYLEQGQIYSEARISAGYDYEIKQHKALDKLGKPPEIPNPIVMKGLNELKRVVNAIIKEYGKPDIIRLEMARDLEMNTKRYKSFTTQQNKNTKLNEQAQEQFQNIAQANPQMGLSKYASHTDKLKYRLWQEQEQRCAYSNQQISLSQLFTGAVEIDHILPYSLTLNDSYMNKVVCLASENQFKGQRTPIEAFESNPKKWEQIEQAISHWYKKGLANKRDAFYKKADDLDKDFINSQLTDTRYISREALHYLTTLGSDVTTVKGQVTSWLRHIWGMNSLIDSNKSEKDRADHRHHAIDAAVIACIDRKLYKTIVNVAKSLEKQSGTLNIKDLHVDPIFKSFRKEVSEKLKSLLIAHAPEQRLSGALHEDTGIGFIDGIGAVYRKNLDESFSARSIENIIDPTVRQILQKHIAKHDGKPKIAFSKDNPVMHKDGITPIKRVRVLQSKTTLQHLEKSKLGIKDKQGNVFKWMTLGNTHHVEIFRHPETGKYQSRFITTLEAKRRLYSKQTIINPLLDEHNFCFALHKNDLVSARSATGETQYYRVQKFSADTSQITLRDHYASTLDNKKQEIRKSVSTLMQAFEMQLIRSNTIGKVLND